MNCPRCGNPVPARRQYCEVCGTDISIYRKIIRLSNRYYNSGLEKAKVRNLTGAAQDLQKSLEMNKRNIEARNLLGLVYYEMGETISALSEWVISKSFSPDANEAEDLLEKVQDNQNELENINQAIKKYNIALEAAKEQNDDLAILQLKKVVSLHGNFLRALQLLALLLIKTDQYDQAKKYLDRAIKIDVGNTTTLRYLAEIARETGEDNPRLRENESKDISKETPRGIGVVSSYREEKPNVMVFVNLLLGVLIGIAVVYYLIVPTIKSNIKEEYESQKVDYSAELSAKTAENAQQAKTIAALERQVNELQTTIDGIDTTPVTVEVGTEGYRAFFDVLKEYKLLKSTEYSDDQLQKLALDLWSVDASGIDSEYALSMLEDMRSDIYPTAARKIYKAGKALYDSADYEGAAGMLEAAVAFNRENDAAMYYLGKSYQALSQFDKAIEYYKLMLEVCPNSTLKEYIPQRLRECGYTE